MLLVEVSGELEVEPLLDMPLLEVLLLDDVSLEFVLDDGIAAEALDDVSLDAVLDGLDSELLLDAVLPDALLLEVLLVVSDDIPLLDAVVEVSVDGLAATLLVVLLSVAPTDPVEVLLAVDPAGV